LNVAIAVLSVVMMGLIVRGQAAASGEAATRSSAIAFERRVSGGRPEIWVMNADGSGQRRVTKGCCFDWSPDGRWIAFVADDGDAYVVSVDGGTTRRITTASRWGPELDWSRDGTRIAVATDSGILVVEPDGTTIGYATTGKHDWSARWSPNGRQILFDRSLSEGGHTGSEIFVVRSDGSSLRRLTRELGNSSGSWAPGGRRVTFQGWVEIAGDWNAEIWVTNADGSDQRKLTDTPNLSEGGPEWSPGGARILFTTKTRAYTIAPDGRRYRNIAGRVSQPDWSPDGTKIVFARRRSAGARSDIWMMSATGREQVNLTGSSRDVHNTEPEWAPARP
jgi:Tol biopolymer transport system component